MFSAISLLLLSSFGLGLAALFPLYRGGKLRLIHGAWGLCAGLLIRYGLVLAIPSLHRVRVLGLLGAAAGAALLALAARRGRVLLRPRRLLSVKFLVLLAVAAAFFGKTLASPLVSWDARSIWFFHGKIIYHNDGLSRAAGLNDGSVVFSHPGYPKFVAALAALEADMQGLWNEYSPKFALFELQLAALLFTFVFFSHSYRFAFLLLFLPLQSGSYLWNGYMDASLAWFSGLGVLFFTRYLQGGGRAMAVSAILASGAALALKSEGVVYLFVIVVVGALSVAFVYDTRRILSDIRTHILSLAYLLVLALFPFAAWTRKQRTLGIPSELWFDPGLLDRLADRLRDGHSLHRIVTESLLRSHLQLCLTVLALAVVWRVWSGRCGAADALKAVFPAFGSALLYYACLVFIYLTTPNDLSWHLGTSVDRTMLTVSGFLVVAIYALVGDSRGQPPRPAVAPAGPPGYILSSVVAKSQSGPGGRLLNSSIRVR